MHHGAVLLNHAFEPSNVFNWSTLSWPLEVAMGKDSVAYHGTSIIAQQVSQATGLPLASTAGEPGDCPAQQVGERARRLASTAGESGEWPA